MEHSNEATAYHEAGHAVVALALGRPVNRVTTVPGQKRAGSCEFHKGTFRPSDDWLEREILIALGGVAAEARHTGTYAWDGAAHDERIVESLAIQRAGVRRTKRLHRRLLAKVEHLLAQVDS
jgi:ATP-dependent Zn protease